MDYAPPSHPSLEDSSRYRLTRLILKAFWAVMDLLRRPAYAVPILINVTGSVWFFLLIGQAGKCAPVWLLRLCFGFVYELDVEVFADGFRCIELSLTVPITNSLAFLFTVLGEWYAEGKVISRGEPCGSSFTRAE